MPLSGTGVLAMAACQTGGNDFVLVRGSVWLVLEYMAQYVCSEVNKFTIYLLSDRNIQGSRF